LLASGFLDAAGRVAVGLDTARGTGTPDVRLDTGLVAAETNPGARLTFGKQIRSRWDVVFFSSLQDSGGLTWIVGYKKRDPGSISGSCRSTAATGCTPSATTSPWADLRGKRRPHPRRLGA
jgi:hypothetical protein